MQVAQKSTGPDKVTDDPRATGSVSELQELFMRENRKCDTAFRCCYSEGEQAYPTSRAA